MSKKGQTSTDTPILLGFIVFQLFIIIMLGFLDVGNNDVTTSSHTEPISGFTINILTNIKELGWGNTLIFAPIEICLIYIIAKLIRGGG